MAGVAVRALHHYDRLGLLRAGRSGAGYRVYREGDLERLEQIVALKFLGLPLQQIRELPDRDGRDLRAALRATKDWSELIADVEKAVGEDPASDRVQALATRWRKLVEGFTGGDAEVSAGLRKLYADQANWPGDFQQQMKPFMKQEVWELMARAMACKP